MTSAIGYRITAVIFAAASLQSKYRDGSIEYLLCLGISVAFMALSEYCERNPKR